jgi:hypothetical protein
MRPIAFITTLLSALLLPTALARAAGTWTWPVRGQVVTQYRNGDDPYAAAQHRGIDIAAPVGTPVAATTGGTIQYAGVVGSSGLTVSERTADGRYALSYLHLSTLAVHRGDRVTAGAVVGAVGVSGRRSTEQPHLHFGVRLASDRHAYVDPLSFLAPLPTDGRSPRPVPVPVAARVPARGKPVAVAPPVPGMARAGAAAPAPLAGTMPALAPAVAGTAPLAWGVPAPSAAGASNGAQGLTRPHGGAPSAATSGDTATTASQHPAAPLLHARAHAVRSPAHAAAPRRHGAVQTAGPAGMRTPQHGPPSVRQSGSPHAHLQATRAAPTHHPDGLDAGWLAACIGLVTAAALLGRSAGGDPRRGSARAVFGALVRAGSRG